MLLQTHECLLFTTLLFTRIFDKTGRKTDVSLFLPGKSWTEKFEFGTIIKYMEPDGISFHHCKKTAPRTITKTSATTYVFGKS